MGVDGIRDIDRINRIRRKRAREYADCLKNLPSITTPVELTNRKHVYDEYVVMLSEDDEARRNRIVSFLNDSGIEVHVHYPILIYLQPYYRTKYGYRSGMFAVAERAALSVFSLPVHHELTEREPH